MDFHRPLLRRLVQTSFRWTRALTLGVRGMVIDSDDRVLLVRHGYAKGWHMPGGGVEHGETLLDAMTRELREEGGVHLTAPPQLHGICANFAIFPGDHIAVFVVRAFDRPTVPASSFEIREQGFFATNALPDGTTDGTRRRIAEVQTARPCAANW